MRRIISLRYANRKERDAYSATYQADVDSRRRGETGKDAAEALIFETRYQMFLLCSNTDGRPITRADLGSGAEVG
jgi:hypothetical protein